MVISPKKMYNDQQVYEKMLNILAFLGLQKLIQIQFLPSSAAAPYSGLNLVQTIVLLTLSLESYSTGATQQTSRKISLSMKMSLQPCLSSTCCCTSRPSDFQFGAPKPWLSCTYLKSSTLTVYQQRGQIPPSLISLTPIVPVRCIFHTKVFSQLKVNIYIGYIITINTLLHSVQ